MPTTQLNLSALSRKEMTRLAVRHIREQRCLIRSELEAAQLALYTTMFLTALIAREILWGPKTTVLLVPADITGDLSSRAPQLRVTSYP